MCHDSGALLPGYVRTNAREDVARAVVIAIERGAEIDVAPLPLRMGAAAAGLAPELVAKVQRQLGADELARQPEGR